MTGFEGISHLTKHQSQKLGPRASDQCQPCSFDDAPVVFRPKPEFWIEILKNRIPPDFIWGTEAMSFEAF